MDSGTSWRFTWMVYFSYYICFVSSSGPYFYSYYTCFTYPNTPSFYSYKSLHLDTIFNEEREMKTKLEEMKREAKTWVKTYEHDNGHGDSEYYFSKTILTLIAIVTKQAKVLEFY